MYIFLLAQNKLINATQIVSRETPESDNDVTCAELKEDECFQSATRQNQKNYSSRPGSLCSESGELPWIDIVSGNKKQQF